MFNWPKFFINKTYQEKNIRNFLVELKMKKQLTNLKKSLS